MGWLARSCEQAREMIRRRVQIDDGLRVVGSGPVPLPGERRRRQRAADEARRMLREHGKES